MNLSGFLFCIKLNDLTLSKLDWTDEVQLYNIICSYGTIAEPSARTIL